MVKFKKNKGSVGSKGTKGSKGTNEKTLVPLVFLNVP